MGCASSGIGARRSCPFVLFERIKTRTIRRIKMNGEGVCYPAFLLGGSNAKFMAFKGPEGLFVSERFRPAVGARIEDVLIDSSGRSWTLHAVTAVGRWGAWD